MAKSYDLVYLASDKVSFRRQGDTLSLTLMDGEVSVHYPRVILRACFPVSDSEAFLSVRDASEERHREIGIIEDWTKLRAEDREAIAAELRLYYLVPKITRIEAIKEELGFLYWTVETDKGPQSFVMRNNVTQNTREVSPNHWLVIDVNDARHEIPDVTALDVRSQRLLERYLSL
jgi:hypothetical protein